jgi:hypothetical protein
MDSEWVSAKEMGERQRIGEENTALSMGFIADIEAMPNEYEYGRQFFDLYYRPEYTTIIVAGVDPKLEN